MTLSWLSIARLGLVQMCLGAIVVLMTSTLNRLMTVELALPAVVPGALVALHYGIQITRPNWGFASDTGGRRARWIIGGMALLATGGMLAALALVLIPGTPVAGLGLSVIAYALIGMGVAASGTSLLALLAGHTAPHRRAAAATITWLMMIFGIAMTAGLIGQFLDPYTPARLLVIVAVVTCGALLLTCLAVAGLERGLAAPRPAQVTRFRDGLRQVWAERPARHFTIFVFLAMTAYFMQELILEPFAGLVFGLTAGETTSLSGAQNGGVFVGMLMVGTLCTGLRLGALRHWVLAGCIGSAAMLAAIAMVGQAGAAPALTPAVIGLGFFNGMFAVAAIGAMMAQAGEGRAAREGTRMGLWGAAQALAAGFGGLAGAVAADVMRSLLASDAAAFGTVFLIEAMLFMVAAAVAARIMSARATPAVAALIPGE